MTAPAPSPRQVELDRRRAYVVAQEFTAANQCAEDCLERAECDSEGDFGHFQCGVCLEHKQPRHHCGCLYTRVPDEPETHSEKYRTMLREGWF